jgi:hypothetical protein
MIDKRYVESFFKETTENFLFLEKQYNYKKLEEYIKSPNDIRDATALSRYVGSRVGIRISWYFANSSISISFIGLEKPEVFPESVSFYPLVRSNVPKAINLYTLAEMVGTLDDPDFLLQDIEKSRQRNKRTKIIETNMRGVMAGLAQATQTYATAILKGDTSIFSKVMNYELAKQKRLYPDLFIPD